MGACIYDAALGLSKESDVHLWRYKGTFQMAVSEMGKLEVVDVRRVWENKGGRKCTTGAVERCTGQFLFEPEVEAKSDR